MLRSFLFIISVLFMVYVCYKQYIGLCRATKSSLLPIPGVRIENMSCDKTSVVYSNNGATHPIGG